MNTLQTAGASPVEPSQAIEPLTETQLERGMMALLSCAASDLEALSPIMYETYKDDVNRVYSAVNATSTREQ
jgi:hypothetical protein